MRLDLTLNLLEPRTLPELQEQPIQLRAAVEILASQTADRRAEPDDTNPPFERISAHEVRAAELPIETPADIGAGLDVLREIIEPDWQYADLRDARLFDAIREGVGALSRSGGDTTPGRQPIALEDTRDEVIHSLALVSEVLHSRYRANGGPGDRAANDGACRLVDDQIEKVRSVRDALK